MTSINQFSIILPVRNGGNYVKECVHSILAQTYPHFNLIVLDNCSDDGTIEWIESLKNDKIVVNPSDKPLGIVRNWARIKDVEKNEFITLIGHDDLLHTFYLEEMNCLINQYPDASLYQTHFKYIDDKGGFVKDCQQMQNLQSASEFIECHFLGTLDSMGTGYMFRSKDYDRLGGMPTNYPNLIFADYELWIRLTKINYKATSAKECFSYRLHNSTSKTTNGDEYRIAFEQYVLLLHQLQKEDALIDDVIQKHSKYFLMYYCQALSHRILKTDAAKRKIGVNDFVKKCIQFAKQLIPTQQFNPYMQPKILAAVMLDNAFGQKIFSLYKYFIKS